MRIDRPKQNRNTRKPTRRGYFHCTLYRAWTQAERQKGEAMRDLLIAISIICAAAVILAGMIARAKAQEAAASERRAALEAMQAQSRAKTEAETQARAMQLYALQSAMDVIKGQAQAAAYTQAQTVAALSKSLDAIGEDQRTIAKLQELQSRAIVDTYTRLCLTDKGEYRQGKGSGRYWEEVDYYA